MTLLSVLGWAQSSPAPQTPAAKLLAKDAKKTTTLHLTPVETVLAPSEVATGFEEPLPCDQDGNLYLRNDDRGPAAIRKLSPKGERVALYQPAANPDLQVGVTGYFSVTPDGELFALAFAKNEISRYVLVFKPDGSYKAKIKLDPGFPWIPATLSVFPNGTLLVTGQEYVREHDKPMLPFTGIFAADGSLLKEIPLEDDDTITDMAATHDDHVTSSQNPASNRAVSWGRAETASDGNVYVMRWLSPALFYAISPGGQVVRRFQVDPADANLEPASIHISGNRIAVLFENHQTMEKLMKIVDLEGHELATYDEVHDQGRAKLEIGVAFACYTSKPERFTFLTTNDDHRLELKHVEAR